LESQYLAVISTVNELAQNFDKLNIQTDLHKEKMATFQEQLAKLQTDYEQFELKNNEFRKKLSYLKQRLRQVTKIIAPCL